MLQSLFGKRYGVKKIVLTGADESAWAVKDFLKENNIPVLLDDPLNLPKYDDSDIKLPFKLASMFKKEGILVGLTYSAQAYGNLPFAAGQTVAYGLTKEEALQTVTLNSAKILGIDDKTGSIEVGKDANIVVSTGDILDMATNNIEYAFITGRNISLDNKHKQLYRRFNAKYEQHAGRQVKYLNMNKLISVITILVLSGFFSGVQHKSPARSEQPAEIMVQTAGSCLGRGTACGKRTHRCNGLR